MLARVRLYLEKGLPETGHSERQTVLEPDDGGKGQGAHEGALTFRGTIIEMGSHKPLVV